MSFAFALTVLILSPVGTWPSLFSLVKCSNLFFRTATAFSASILLPTAFLIVPSSAGSRFGDEKLEKLISASSGRKTAKFASLAAFCRSFEDSLLRSSWRRAICLFFHSSMKREVFSLGSEEVPASMWLLPVS